MRYLGMNRKALEFNVVVIVIFSLILLILLLLVARQNFTWITALFDRIFGL